ncbi:MAG: peptidylprolyl isomerase [Salinibacter sp.]
MRRSSLTSTWARTWMRATWTCALMSVLLLTGCSGSAPTTSSSGDAPTASTVVARYADTTLTLSALKSAYQEANDRPAPDSGAALANFLGQYVNYRLKVRAARAAGLDTLTSVRRDMRTYRRELARPRLMRTHVYGPVVRRLYNRRKQEVDVSHILLRVGPDAPPADTLRAYRQMQRIADSLRRGVSFGDLAYRNSDDPSARKKGERGYRGHLGYVRAGEMVKPFEDRMYRVPPDSVSGIFRTQFGYHLLKVHDRRPARPPVRLSHIMVRAGGSAASPRQFLDSLRTEIVQKGADFAELARSYSEHRPTAAKGGDLGMIESRRALPSAFRKAVAQLDSVGAVSQVVRTKYGYHLIKLTKRKSQPSFEAAYDRLKKKVSNRPSIDRRKTQFARRVRAEAGVSVDTAQILRQAPISSLDSLARPLLSLLDADATADPPIATLGDSTYTLAQLAHHVTQTDGGARMSAGEVLQDQKAFRYAQARLEKRNPAFAAKMQEYRDGLLAFRFMQDSVWTPAARDTAALRRYYRRHRAKYRFGERVRTLVLRAPADSLLTPYTADRGKAVSTSTWQRAAMADSLVSLDTMMVSDRSAEVYRQVLSIDDGRTVGPVLQGGQSLLLYRDARLPPRPKTFAEARSSVVQDYRKQYENQVLRRLRRRYDAETYPGRVRQAVDKP